MRQQFNQYIMEQTTTTTEQRILATTTTTASSVADDPSMITHDPTQDDFDYTYNEDPSSSFIKVFKQPARLSPELAGGLIKNIAGVPHCDGRSPTLRRSSITGVDPRDTRVDLLSRQDLHLRPSSQQSYPTCQYQDRDLQPVSLITDFLSGNMQMTADRGSSTSALCHSPSPAGDFPINGSAELSSDITSTPAITVRSPSHSPRAADKFSQASHASPAAAGSSHLSSPPPPATVPSSATVRSPLTARRGRGGLRKRSVDLLDSVTREEDKRPKRVKRTATTSTINPPQQSQKSTRRNSRRIQEDLLTTDRGSPDDLITTPIPNSSGLDTISELQSSIISNGSPSAMSPRSPSFQRALTPLRNIASRVLRPFFSFSSGNENRTTEIDANQPVSKVDTEASPSSRNPFAGLSLSSSSFLSSKLLGRKRHASTVVVKSGSHTESDGVNLLQKFPNFLSSSSTSALHIFSATCLNSSGLSKTELPELISQEMGGKIIFATDEFFASAENLLKSSEPEWRENTCSRYGKCYDGWQTRRRRTPGHDWCLIELGIPGRVRKIQVDTIHSTGNCAPQFSIEAAYVPDLDQQIHATLKKSNHEVYKSGSIGVSQPEEAISAVNELLLSHANRDPRQWRDLVGISMLRSGFEDKHLSKQIFEVRTGDDDNPTSVDTCTAVPFPPSVVTHIRLNLFPDGGIARLRIFGSGAKKFKENESQNLAGIANGGLPLLCSNQYFGAPVQMLLNTAPTSMESGWLTARNPLRAPILELDSVTGKMKNLAGEELVVIRLCCRATVTHLEIDTKHFIGSHPESVQVKGIDLADVDFEDLSHQRNRILQSDVDEHWSVLLSRTKLRPDTNHIWHSRLRRGRPPNKAQRDSRRELATRRDGDGDSNYCDSPVITLDDIGPVTHLCMIIYPDGGIARLRVFGKTLPSGKGS